MDDLDLALHLAEAASEIVRSQFGTRITATYKGAVDPVTEVDQRAEALVRDLIAEHRPNDEILGEEQGGDTELTGRTWIIDPLDGTVNFLHGIPHVSVSIALTEGGMPIAGVVVDVMGQEVFSASLGHGAHLNGRPIAVSTGDDLTRSLVAVGFPYDRIQRAEEYASLIGRLLASTQGVRRMGSAALDLAYVACGRFDGYIEQSLQPWDIAAGSLLIAEAGGVISAADGAARPLLDTGPVVASNGQIHDGLIDVL